ncbi:MAG: 50S ribosomal protein L3 [Candidatus Hadarchaeum sp.]
MASFKFLLGEKIGMTQIFVDNKVVPVTIIKAGPCFITNLRFKDRDGYSAVQIGLKDEKKNNKFKKIKEFRLINDPQEVNIGEEIKVTNFSQGDIVQVRGKRKAKGFSGVVKRHHFRGGPRTHGQENKERAPGSIGQRWPQRVRKGLKMAGRIAPLNVTIKNLEIVGIEPEDQLLLLKGSVPGPNKSIIEIKAIDQK